MIVCITEKPSVAKDIAAILGANAQRQGYYEGNGYCVTWTFGHLCCLKDPADYCREWRRWSLAYLPMIPPKFGIKVMDDKGVQHQFSVIESLIKQADKIINCGDAGQEGELIQRWVMQKAGCDKPVERLWISSLTDQSIREGFKNLKPEKELENLYLAGLCRAIGDWILGINATRLYTLKYRPNKLGDTNAQPLSVGRVQTPTLALVVNRQREIENFVPKDSWELRTRYRDTVFSSTLKPFDKEEKGQKAVESLQGTELEITKIDKKKGKEAPPRLFDLTSLQVEANKKFNMGAEDTLRTIQSLYEKKLTTYPRVDTTYLTDDVYPQCGPILGSLMNRFEDILTPIRKGKLKKSKKVFDNSKVTDHHAIIPTGQPLPLGLSTAELNIFDLIARRFISVFHPDCEFEQTTVEAKADKYNFKATGKVIINPGWKICYQKDQQQTAPALDSKDSKEKEEQTLPVFTKGERGPHSPFLAKKTSQPPKYYTEGTLLKAMETAGSQIEDEDLREQLKANGIGRPSTRASIIEILYKRGYIRKERKSLRATEDGCALIDTIQEELLKSAKLTGIWEGRLRAIERGEYSPSEFVTQLKDMIRQITLDVLRDNTNQRIGQNVS